MSEPFLAEVRMWACNFPPRGWMYCEGQLLPISQYSALFSLIGTTYGGDGRTTTGLPNLTARMPMHPGSGPGLVPRNLGVKVGTATVALTEAQIPSHKHTVSGNKGRANHPNPEGNALARGNSIYSTGPGMATENMSSSTVANEGSGQGHNNQSPYLNVGFTICVQGLYPSRS